MAAPFTTPTRVPLLFKMLPLTTDLVSLEAPRNKVCACWTPIASQIALSDYFPSPSAPNSTEASPIEAQSTRSSKSSYRLGLEVRVYLVGGSPQAAFRYLNSAPCTEPV
jgi:hypothetical protein